MAEEKATDAAAAQHVESPPLENVQSARAEVSRWVGVTLESRNATEREHGLSLMEGIRQYPKACFWSMVVSLVVIMDGYDTALIGTLFGFPAFRQRFGVENIATGTYQVTEKWQDALGLASPLGNVVGIFINGVLSSVSNSVTAVNTAVF
jgi:SP family general alpha glucoside:H+ symporter-like MFS transporter